MKGILITWGTPVAGRERFAIEEFASYTQWVSSLKAQGKILRYELYMPQFGTYEHFAGFSVVEGSKDEIEAILDSDDFRVRVQRVLSVCHDARVESLDVGEDVAKRMKLYSTTIQQLKA